MSSATFRIVEHTAPGQHIRQYPRSLAGSQQDQVCLSVNQYIPLGQGSPRNGDVTILACHASGCPKELYEPIWDALLQYGQRTRAFRIRAIWAIDFWNHNASGVVNQDLLGQDPSWFDHGRDLLSIVNHFRTDMIRPIVGFGHSLGGAALLNLALLHPRLLTTIITIEPPINKRADEMTFMGTYAIAFRKNGWPSRLAAEEFIRQSTFYKHWHPRILDLWMRYGLKERQDGTVELTTSPDQELMTFARPAHPPPGQSLASLQPTLEQHPELGDDRLLCKNNAFYRPEVNTLFDALPHVRPSVCYIYGTASHMVTAREHSRKDKLEATGIGRDGSGGVVNGQVIEYLLPGSHFVPFERPNEVADKTGEWLAQQVAQWRKTEEQQSKEWERVPRNQRAKIPQDSLVWIKTMHERRKAASKSNGKAKL